MSLNFTTRQLTLNRQLLTATGSQLYLNGLLVGSGIYASIDALQGTGSILDARISSLSGFTTGLSGALQAQIGNAGSQVRVSGSSTIPIVNLTGIGGVNIFASGSQVFISGGSAGGVSQAQLDALSGYANATFATKTTTDLISGNLTQTGVLLGARIDAVSGLVLSASGSNEAHLVATGNAAVAFANGMGTIISGNLTTTGQTLIARDLIISGTLATGIAQSGAATLSYANGIGTNLSGNLTQTGILLAARDLVISGTLTTGIAATGQAAWISANGAATTLSGNATLTGQALLARDLLISGQLSTGIAQTGSTLDAKITSLSGFTIGASGALQAQITAGAGTQVRVTGSTTLTVADLTGIGGLIVLYSGNQVFISGGSAGVTQAQLDSVSGWAAANLAATGTILYILLSGLSGQIGIDYATKIQLTQTGVSLGSKIDSFSGYVAATYYPNSNPSGYTTGGINQGQLNSVSGWIDGNFVHRTGNEFISGDKTWTGNAYFTSGRVGIGTTNPNPIGLLTVNGNVLQDRSGDALYYFIDRTNNSGNYNGFSFQRTRSDGLASEKWFVGTQPNSNTFKFIGEGGVNTLALTSNGNVGIGTTNPILPLHVAGGGYFTNGISGVSNASNAARGYIGEYIEASIPEPSGRSLTLSTDVNLTGIPLDAGDWDVDGIAYFTKDASTALVNFSAWSSTGSATLPSRDSFTRVDLYPSTTPATVFGNLILPTTRYPMSASGTVYLSVRANFSVSTVVAFGKIRARRVR